MKKADTHKDSLFLSVVERYDAMLRRVCFMYTAPGADYDDLYQETMINLWRGLDSFRGDAQLSTWVYRTAVNTCLSWHRSVRRHTQNRTDLDAAAHLVAGDDTERVDQLKDMYHAISQLDPLEKAVVMLWLDGYPYADIAEVTGLSPNNVAVKLNRIKTKLKKINS